MEPKGERHRPSARDGALATAAVIWSAVPVFGGPVAEVISRIPTDRQRRQDEYLRKLGSRVEALGASLDEDYVRSEDFAILAEEILEKVARRRELEKMDAWANALANAASGAWEGEDDLWRMVDILERLRPQHLHLLALLASIERHSDPVPWSKRDGSQGGSIEDRWREGFGEPSPRMRDDWDDLQRDGLLFAWPIPIDPQFTDLRASVTPLGERFIAFVADVVGQERRPEPDTSPATPSLRLAPDRPSGRP